MAVSDSQFVERYIVEKFILASARVPPNAAPQAPQDPLGAPVFFHHLTGNYKQVEPGRSFAPLFFPARIECRGHRLMASARVPHQNKAAAAQASFEVVMWGAVDERIIADVRLMGDSSGLTRQFAPVIEISESQVHLRFGLWLAQRVTETYETPLTRDIFERIMPSETTPPDDPEALVLDSLTHFRAERGPLFKCNPSGSMAILQDFQRESLKWCHSKEKSPNRYPHNLCGWVKLSNWWVNPLSLRTEPNLPQFSAQPPGGLLADDAGLGKTLTMISLIKLNQRPSETKPTDPSGQTKVGATLIIAPSHLLSQWAAEVEKYAPELKTIIYDTRDKKIAQAISSADIVLTSYTRVCHEKRAAENKVGGRRSQKQRPSVSSPLMRFHFWRVVLDEAHLMRVSVATNVIHSISRVNSWAVTASPVQQSVRDLFEILKFLGIEWIPTMEAFGRLIASPDNLALLVSRIGIRHTRQAAATSLPTLKKRLVTLPAASEEATEAAHSADPGDFDNPASFSEALDIVYWNCEKKFSNKSQLGLKKELDLIKHSLPVSDPKEVLSQCVGLVEELDDAGYATSMAIDMAHKNEDRANPVHGFWSHLSLAAKDWYVGYQKFMISTFSIITHILDTEKARESMSQALQDFQNEFTSEARDQVRAAAVEFKPYRSDPGRPSCNFDGFLDSQEAIMVRLQRSLTKYLKHSLAEAQGGGSGLHEKLECAAVALAALEMYLYDREAFLAGRLAVCNTGASFGTILPAAAWERNAAAKALAENLSQEMASLLAPLQEAISLGSLQRQPADLPHKTVEGTRQWRQDIAAVRNWLNACEKLSKKNAEIRDLVEISSVKCNKRTTPCYKLKSIHQAKARRLDARSQCKYMWSQREKEKEHPSVLEECMICAGEDEVYALTPCGHYSGAKCLELWIESRISDELPPICIACREEISLKDLVYFTKEAGPPKRPVSSRKKGGISGIKLKGKACSAGVAMIARHVLWLHQQELNAQVVVFSREKTILEEVNDLLGLNGITVFSGLQAAQKFSSSHWPGCLLLGPGPCLEGLNLANAGHLVLCSELEPEMEEQVTLRLHRLGSSGATIWRFVEPS